MHSVALQAAAFPFSTNYLALRMNSEETWHQEQERNSLVKGFRLVTTGIGYYWKLETVSRKTHETK
jgi:hypothetical protein